MDIIEVIKDILVTDVYVEIPREQIGVDDSMRDVLGVDSLGFVELQVQCEDRFGITIGEDDFNPENFATIARLEILIRTLRESAST